MIEIENVSKRFLFKKALKNCSLTLNQGKIIGIIGENGSGKTTLLKLLAGVLKPSSGRVLIEQNIVTRSISQKVAYLSDIENFFTYFTVHELIQFYASQFKDFDRSVALKIAQFMHLPLDMKIKQLSRGNLGRVKITVTFARRAPYIILDEPFAGLDPLVRKKMIHSMIKFVDLAWQTLILTTHHMKDIQQLLDEVVLLREGRILTHKNVEDIREYDNVDLVTWMEDMYESMSAYS